MKRDLNVVSILFLIALLLHACRPGIESTSEALGGPEPTVIIVTATPALPAGNFTQIYTTQNNLQGNRFTQGSIDLQSATVTDIPLDGTPLWLVSAPFSDGALFTVVLEDGRTRTFHITGQSYRPYEILTEPLPAGMPPLLAVSDGIAQLIVPPQDASPFTNPVMIHGKLAYIDVSGNLVLSDTTSQIRLPVNALPDARLLLDKKDRLLLLTGPTSRYGHGVLGDELEASAMTLIETDQRVRVVNHISIGSQDVIEGIAPIWADLDDNGVDEIIVTLSNNHSGARIAAYREDGSLLAESNPIGMGQRWRHQIAVARFRQDQPPLIVSIRTPHIGGVVEFFQLNEGKLEIVHEIAGFSSHTLSSRNLDSAIAGDFNKDGVIELLAPDQLHSFLSIISFDGVLAVIPLDGGLTSNLSVTNNNGELWVGAGSQGNLRIWSP